LISTHIAPVADANLEVLIIYFAINQKPFSTLLAMHPSVNFILGHVAFLRTFVPLHRDGAMAHVVVRAAVARQRESRFDERQRYYESQLFLR
jgi:hypothetical protein